MSIPFSLDGPVSTSTPSTPPENVEASELSLLSQGYGPKRVKTPNMEVEQFDPLTIMKMQERQTAVYPTFGNLHFDIASPSCGYSKRFRKSLRRHQQDCSMPDPDCPDQQT